MFKVRVIPCLDVKDGRVVKGVNFVDLRDSGDPVEAAIAYDAAGADELCFLDINATHHRPVMSGTVTAVATPIAVGRTTASVEIVITDDEGRRTCTCRFTAQLRDAPPSR